MQAEKFLKMLKQLRMVCPSASVYITDNTGRDGTFETMYLEMRVDQESKAIWIIFDTEDGCDPNLKELFDDLSQISFQHPGYDVVFEDCFAGKNTFETYFVALNIDEDDNKIELQLDAEFRETQISEKDDEPI